MLDRFQAGIGGSLRKAFAGTAGSGREAAWAFVGRVMRDHHFTPGAQQWPHQNVNLKVDDSTSTRGGGFGSPEPGKCTSSPRRMKPACTNWQH